jgi:thiamine biosynthesis lipoprotein
MKRLLILFAFVGLCLALRQKHAPQPAVLTGRAMGCEWKLLTDQRIDHDPLRLEIAAILERWEQVLSTWRADSDLSRHNHGEPATPDLARVLRLAGQLHTDTGGAFDHRMLGPLTKAGFGPGGEGIDLSSIGKGFAVDRVCEMLASRGIRRHVFSLAGEVRAGEGSWPVGIEGPDGIAESLPLSGQAMATSGNYRQWREARQGRLVSHILDPATGEPVLRPPCSVTVIGPDAATASAWATALFVTGPGQNPAAGSRGLKVIWHGQSE